jgi:hypothetical protein
MKSISLNNPELKQILDTFIDVFQTEDKSRLRFSNQDKARSGTDPVLNPDYACSNEYLQEMQSKKNVTGYPEITYGTDFMLDLADMITNKRISDRFAGAVKKMDQDLMMWSGSRFNAVKMYYPKGGFMGWHHNANCPGYNVLLSWSKDGSGFFRYQDPATKEIVTIPDTPGWTAKVGYYGAFHEPDRIYWHCAWAKNEDRLTLGYVIPHIGLWEDMVEDIQAS